MSKYIVPPALPELPDLYINLDTYFQIQEVIKYCSTEVGLWCHLEKVDKDTLIIKSPVYVPEQTVHGTETDIEPDAMARMYASSDSPDTIRCWIHSHVNMSTTPSPQDFNQLMKYQKYGGIFVMGVWNKKGETTYFIYDFDKNIKDESRAMFAVSNGEQLREEVISQVKENVKERVYVNEATNQISYLEGAMNGNVKQSKTYGNFQPGKEPANYYDDWNWRNWF